MPYNVLGFNGSHSKIAYCGSASEACEVSLLWAQAGVRDLHVVSTDGKRIESNRLVAIARSERLTRGPTMNAGQQQQWG